MSQAGTKKVGRDLTSGPIMSSLLSFAIPIVITDIIQQLYSMVDLMIIGRYVGNTGTVGVNTGGEIADFLMPIAVAFAAAGQIYIAQLSGAKRYEDTRSAIGTFITIMLSAALVLMVLTILLTNPVLAMLNCPEEALGQARSYMIITALGLPFIFGYNAVCGVLRGMGESQRPLIFIIVAATVNIFLDIFLVAVIPLQAAGTAIATVFSQIAAFLACFIYMYRHKETFEFELKLSYFRFDRHHAEILLKLGLPQAIRSTLVRASMLWINANINACGAIASGTNGIGNKLQKFLELFSQSLSQASAAMVGQNLGAKKYDRARKAVLSAVLTATLFGIAVSILISIFPQQVFGIFTKDADVKALGVFYIRMLCVHIIVSAITSSFQSMVIGSGNASLNFIIGILDGVICKIGISLLLVHVIYRVTPETDWFTTTLGYFWGTGLSRILPGIVCIIYFYSNHWKKKDLLSN